MNGYHLTEITKGELGKLSKIREELNELEDAELQNNRIMMLVELSDLVGSIEEYLERQFSGQFELADLIQMSKATKRAFESGERK